MKKKDRAQYLTKSMLQRAIDITPDVKGHFREGLGAIKGNERSKFIVPDTRKITGSLDIDGATEQRYRSANRWDYAIEYNGETFFIEVHPGSTSEILTVLAKLEWLRRWLKEEAPAIDALKPKDKRPYHWIYTNRYAILPNSRYAKLLAQHKLIPVREWNYDML